AHPAPVVVLRHGDSALRWSCYRYRYAPDDEDTRHPLGWAGKIPFGVAWELWHHPDGVRAEGRLLCWRDPGTGRVGWTEPPPSRPPEVAQVTLDDGRTVAARLVRVRPDGAGAYRQVGGDGLTPQQRTDRRAVLPPGRGVS